MKTCTTHTPGDIDIEDILPQYVVLSATCSECGEIISARVPSRLWTLPTREDDTDDEDNDS